VSRGEPWLGWPTTAGAVWMLIFEDKRSEVRKHFRAMGATGTERVHLFVDQAPADLLPQLHELAAKERPALIVVDTLIRALKLKDLNVYASRPRRAGSRSCWSCFSVSHSRCAATIAS
jgi:AAA domain-containing protein